MSPHETSPAPRSAPTAVRLLVVGVLQALAVSPTVVALGLLALSTGPRGATAALAVLSTVLVGPALAAGLFALGDRPVELGLPPAAAFLRGYRLNLLDAAKLWVPALLLLAVLAFMVVDVAGNAPPWVLGIGIGVAGLVLLWLVQATVIAAFFTFPTADTARLGVFFLARLPRVTLLVVALLVLAALVAWLTAPAVLALLGVLWTALLLRVERPVLAEVRQRFVDVD